MVYDNGVDGWYSMTTRFLFQCFPSIRVKAALVRGRKIASTKRNTIRKKGKSEKGNSENLIK